MSILIDSKFKEEEPLATINRIRNILFHAGIFTVETWTDSGIRGCYSVRIEIAGTQIGQNGKGVTREFALASGYAEFMERLQSGYLYVGKTDPELESYQDFLHVPGEKEFTVDEYIREFGHVIKPMLKNENGPEELLRLCRYETVRDPEKDFCALPFQKEGSFETVYFPYPLLKDVYATNGTCAGNTKKEALVQGLSEIIERNHNLRVLTEPVTPPTIPEEYLQNFAAYRMIKEIRKEAECELMIKDCSLGTGFPVIAAVLTSKKSHKYIVKFGAHPVFEIALERTLTEMLQGRKIADAVTASAVSYSIQETRAYDNVHNVLKNASGKYHYRFFGKEEDMKFVPFPDRTKMNNQQLYEYCLSLFQRWGFDIYIRACGYLGFPAYQIIVPGFSEIYNYGTLRLKEKTSLKKSSEILLNLEHATDPQIQTLFLYLRFKQGFSMENTISYTLRQPLLLEQKKDLYFYYYVELCTAVYLKKWKEAMFCGEVLKVLDPEEKDLYELFREMAGGILEGGEIEELLALAQDLYPETIIDKIRKILNWKLCSKEISEKCLGFISTEKDNPYEVYKTIKKRLKEFQRVWNESDCSTQDSY